MGSGTELKSEFAARVAAKIDEAIALFAEQPLRTQLRMLTNVRAQLDAHEADELSKSRLEGSRLEREIQTASTTSRGDARKRRERAELLDAKPDLAEKLSTGEVNGQQVDVLVQAVAKTEGAILSDDEAVGRIVSAGPEQGRKVGNDWHKQQLTTQEVERQHAAARKRREVRIFDGDLPGESVLTVVGDTPTVKQLFNQLSTDADAAYRAAGGRNVSTEQHDTTLGQRLFDALQDRIMSPGESGRSQRNSGSSAPRATVVFTKSLDDPDAPALMNGELIPDSLFDHATCGSELIGQLYNGTGDLIWQGRSTRSPSKALRTALIARDKGCVLCGKDPTFCETHHLLPWHAPGHGTTDPDNMALVCQTCHRHIHDQHLTLEREKTNEAACCGKAASTSKPAVQGAAAKTSASWRLRPAKPHEIPINGKRAASWNENKPSRSPTRTSAA